MYEIILIIAVRLLLSKWIIVMNRKLSISYYYNNQIIVNNLKINKLTQ